MTDGLIDGAQYCSTIISVIGKERRKRKRPTGR